MTFASSINRIPRCFDPDRGDEVLQYVSDQPQNIQQLVRGAAGCSPYLKQLVEKEAVWLNGAFDDIDGAVGAEIEHLSQFGPDTLSSDLRRAKRRVALAAGLADLAGVWDVSQVTQSLTALADGAVDAALKSCLSAAMDQGKLPMFSVDDLDTACGISIIAMGKMGAHELNYSSDIDLICLFDETRLSDDSYVVARAVFIKVIRQMAALLNDRTAEGYVFRTDLRLRPDASVTPVCVSMDAAERYYESVGRTWERAAFIKARICAGDFAAGNAFLERLKPFVWRKHLDFAAIQDAHDMRLKIRDHKGLHGPITLVGHNMKLGRGGIREIEFFTQTRQLIAGGRDADLRVNTTMGGLQVLASKDWIDQDTADRLGAHYVSHRTVEHRLQMINDAQTHDLPKTDDGFDRLADLMDMDRANLETDIYDRLTDVHDLTEGFFAPDPVEETDIPDFGAEVFERWPTYPAMRSERAQILFERIRPQILRRISQAAKPQDALTGFDTFLSGLPAGAQLFSLFETNPQLIDLLLDIASTSPDLSSYLSRNASVFDAVIAGAFFDPFPSVAELTAQMTAELAVIDDYENKLDALRRWMKEYHFRIGVHHLRGLISPAKASIQYAILAEAVVQSAWPAVCSEFARKYGALPGRGAVVLGMGSLGAGRLSATSDLDLIVIYDAQGVETSDGPRSLPTRVYYARLTQAFITALTVPMAQGRLYEVDMRLRPSGKQGPVAISFDGFKAYQRSEAWTWEHLALTRGRVIVGAQGLGGDVESFRSQLLHEKSGGDTILQDVQQMRERIQAAKPQEGVYSTKIGAGRLQDIELFAQTAALKAGTAVRDTAAQIQAGVAIGWVDAAEAQELQQTYDHLWATQVTARLLSVSAFDPDHVGNDGVALMLRDTQTASPQDLADGLERSAQRAADIIETQLQRTDS